MFVVCVEFEVEPGHLDLFMTAIRQNAKQSFSREAGCQQFDVCRDKRSSNSIFLYEVYDSAAAFETHKITPHYGAFKKAISGMVVNKSIRLLNLDSQNR
ncbi:MAG: antibiotic biosynthesis monooxygenase [Flavobacteriaceae bacterium]|nr:antibiotic biosynthesis monooxygenase [Flavobacteriaceae bacterium]|tara:strand:+ start:409 stop:705 length:297 start_codon:yes stop_codon:yes gene_type:complete